MWADACLSIFLKVRQAVKKKDSVFPDKKYNIGNNKVN